MTMYMSYPPEIREWIDSNGGVDKLTVDSYWTLYDRELWAMGYPQAGAAVRHLVARRARLQTGHR